MKTKLLVLLVASLVALAASAQKKLLQIGIPDPVIVSAMDQALDHYVAEKRLSGGVALVMKTNQLVYQKVFGMQDVEAGRPMQLNSLFQIASMTKPVTIVAALILMDEGMLKLDDPAAKYLPEIGKVKVKLEDGTLAEPKSTITIRHLMMHTAGLQPRIDRNQFNNLKDYVDEFLKQPLVHQPGEGFRYNVSTNVVARIVEVISKKPIEVFMKERIFKPLKMESTYYTIPEKDMSRLAGIYSQKQGELKLEEEPMATPAKFPQGGNGLVSTASDYLRFAKMLYGKGQLEGKRLLTEKSVELMTSDLLPRTIYPVTIGGTTFPNCGFGLAVAVQNGNPTEWEPKPLSFSNIGNLPARSYYWPGVTNTYWWVDPANDVYGVLMTQSADPGKHPIFQEFVQAFYGSIYGKEIVSYGTPKAGSAVADIICQEIRFSKECASIGQHQATINLVAEDGILFRPHPHVIKPELEKQEPPKVILKTYPEFIDASASNDMGYIVGVWEFQSHMPFTKPITTGFFCTYYKRQADGQMKVAIAKAMEVGDQSLENYQYSLNYAYGSDFIPASNNDGSVTTAVSASGSKSGLLDQENAMLKTWVSTPKPETYLSFMGSGAKVFRHGEMPASNRNNITKLLSRRDGFTWKQIDGAVSIAGDMGYTYGSTEFQKEGETKKGYYLRFWKKQPDGRWKVVVDIN